MSLPSHAELSINPYPVSLKPMVNNAHTPSSSQGRYQSPADPYSDPVPLVGSQTYSGSASQAPTPVANIPRAGQWHAFKGADAQEIIMHWSNDAGVEVIWSTNDDYDVEETLAIQGTYETAIRALLEQFNGDYFRPVGNLHVDPVTGQKTLVITTHEGT